MLLHTFFFSPYLDSSRVQGENDMAFPFGHGHTALATTAATAEDLRRAFLEKVDSILNAGCVISLTYQSEVAWPLFFPSMTIGPDGVFEKDVGLIPWRLVFKIEVEDEAGAACVFKFLPEERANAPKWLADEATAEE